jgi:hypothetical protein
MGLFELKKEIYTLLSAINSNTYHEKADQTTTVPYIVYSTMSGLSEFENDRLDLIVMIDIFDNKDDTTSLENLTTLVKNGLNRKNVNVTGCAMNLYFDSIFDIIEEDENLRHRQLRFKITSYI